MHTHNYFMASMGNKTRDNFNFIYTLCFVVLCIHTYTVIDGAFILCDILFIIFYIKKVKKNDLTKVSHYGYDCFDKLNRLSAPSILSSLLRARHLDFCAPSFRRNESYWVIKFPEISKSLQQYSLYPLPGPLSKTLNNHQALLKFTPRRPRNSTSSRGSLSFFFYFCPQLFYLAPRRRRIYKESSLLRALYYI